MSEREAILLLLSQMYFPFLEQREKDAITKAIEALQAIEAWNIRADVPDINVGKWIPCNERLPEEDGMHLITSDVLGKLEVQYAFYQRSIGMFICNGIAKAWMPLPEPYKGE